MSKKPPPDDKRFKLAAELLLQLPSLKVPKAMRAEGFTDIEAQDRGLQMRVRRVLEKKKKQMIVPSQVSRTVDGVLVGSPISDSTPAATSNQSSSSSTGLLTAISNSTGTTTNTKKKRNKLPAGVKRIRSTAGQAQQKRINKKKINDNEKAAHKKATTLYFDEKKKEKGMSAQQVCDSVNDKFGSSLSTQSIYRYVNDGKMGESPMKRGPDGGIPEHTFKLLLSAFESFIRINQ